MPRLHVPAFLSYTCQACGRCCHDYEVVLSPAEYERLAAMPWPSIFPALAGNALFERSHSPAAGGPYCFHFDAQGGCDFLDAQGRCLMHAQVGLANKALACRLFPFTFAQTPSGAYVGLRFHCGAAAQGLGEPLARQQDEIDALYRAVGRVAQIHTFPDTVQFSRNQQLPWADYLVMEQALLELLLRPDLTLRQRLYAFWETLVLMREAQLAKVGGDRFGEFMTLLTEGLAGEAAQKDIARKPPGRLARALFRQLLYLLHQRTGSAYHALGLGRRLVARAASGVKAAQFLFNAGRFRPHGAAAIRLRGVEAVSMPEMTPEIQGMLERYLAAKLFGKQIFGPMFFNYDFVTGAAFLLCSFAAILWYARALALGRGETRATDADIAAAIQYVDFTYGYSSFPRLPTERLRLSLLARGDTPLRLAQWLLPE